MQMYYNIDCLGNCTFIVLTFFLNNAIDVMAKNHAIAQLCSKLRLPVLDTTMNQARSQSQPPHPAGFISWTREKTLFSTGHGTENFDAG